MTSQAACGCAAGMYAFSEQQGFGLAALLRENPAVLSVEVTYRNGGMLIYYQPGSKAAVLEQIDAIKKADLPELEAQEHDLSNKLDTDFQMNLVKVTGAHFARKLFLPPLLRNGWTILRAVRYIAKGLKALWHGHLNVDVLDAASISAALAQKSCSTAGSIMFLLSISSLLEEYTCQRTHNALARSLSIHVDQVWRVDGESETLVPMSEIKVNDVIRIRSGNMIPVDGTVCDGKPW